MIVSFLEMQRTLARKLKFVPSERKPHEWYELSCKDGTVILTTHLSRKASGRDIYQNIFSKIARQVGLSNRQLADAVKCDLNLDGYYKILKRKGLATCELA